MQKLLDIDRFIPEIFMFKESYNFFWWEQFNLKLLRQIFFFGYVVFAESYSTISTSILHQFQPKLMAQFCKEVLKPHFWITFHHFWSFFPKKSDPDGAKGDHRNSKKLPNRRTEEWMDSNS